MKLKIQKSNPGFTLIEMLVVIFIIALISGLFLINYRGAERTSSLNNAAQKLVSDIRTAQNSSLGSETFSNVAHPVATVPIGGWGVNFNSASSTYIIFADADGNYKYDSGENFKFISLPPSIVILSIKVDDIASPSNVTDITFVPPDPITIIKSNSVNYNKFRITLRETASNATKIIEVNSFGLINVTQ